ncbi:MAG: hypothetical protein IPQ07_39520 [Myxococcales bacterium]|nr:hypothetical protein [Myxococcales bacterium]
MRDVATRQNQLSRRLGRLAPRALRALGKEVARTAIERALTYTSDDGETQTMPILLAPALLSRADLRYLHRLVLTLYSAVHKTAAARLTDPAVREILPMAEREEAWLRLAPEAHAPLIGRFDMNVDPKVGARGASLLEFNGCAIGGLHYGPAASATVLDRVVPLEPALKVAMPGSMTEAWLEHCRLHTRSLGHPGDRLHIVWLEDRAWETGITEGPTLVEQLKREGHKAAVCDPRDLTLVRDEIHHDGARVDIAYRAIELRDLLAIEDETGPLTVLREAVKRNIVLSPLQGDLDHKSLLEVWSSRRFARLFTPAERRLLARHVLWTRQLTARRTDGLEGKIVELASYVKRQRTKLVCKPIRACGGEGILIGKETSQAAWDRAVDRSISGKDPAVVQRYIQSATIDSPVVRGTKIRHERHFTTFGFYASPSTLGILGRAAPFRVVNVSRGGGILGVLVT